MRQRIALALLLAIVTGLSLGFSDRDLRHNPTTPVATVPAKQVLGFGLVVGLDGTGSQSAFTQQVVEDMLKRLGVSERPNAPDNIFQAGNISAVLVVAELDPLVRVGGRVDVTVSAIDDSVSLQGGSLIITPLRGPDGEVSAMAQGPISTSGKTGSKQTQIRGGAIVEKNTVR